MIIWQKNKIKLEDRRKLTNQKNKVIWLTGLSGSGKSTIASHLEKELFDKNIRCYILDGDNIRHGLNSDLGFSSPERTENIRRIAEVSKLFHDSGTTCIVSFISPFESDRAKAKKLIGQDFIEVYVKCGIEICKNRDPKGLYKLVSQNKIRNFTGIDSPYESPKNPDIVLNTSLLKVDECVKKILDHIKTDYKLE